jgi:hypothetical protein
MPGRPCDATWSRLASAFAPTRASRRAPARSASRRTGGGVGSQVIECPGAIETSAQVGPEWHRDVRVVAGTSLRHAPCVARAPLLRGVVGARQLSKAASRDRRVHVAQSTDHLSRAVALIMSGPTACTRATCCVLREAPCRDRRTREWAGIARRPAQICCADTHRGRVCSMLGLFGCLGRRRANPESMIGQQSPTPHSLR